MSRAVFTIWLLVNCCASVAQESDPANLYEEALQLYENNQRDLADSLVNLVLVQAGTKENATYYIKALVLKSKIFAAVNALSSADSLAELAIHFAEDSAHVLKQQALHQKVEIKLQQYQFDSALHYLAIADHLLPDTTGYSDYLYSWAYLNKRNYDKALEFGQRSHYNTVRSKGSNAKELIRPVQALQITYMHLSLLDSALIYAKLYADLVQEHYPPFHPNRGIAQNILGNVYQNLRNYPLALYHRRECENIFYKDFLRTGQSRFLSAAYNNLGYLYSVTGDFYLAEKYISKALLLSHKDFGESNLANIHPLMQLAYLNSKSGQLEKAHSYYQRALTLQSLLAPDDIGTKNLLINGLAYVLQKREDYELSDSLYAEILEYYRLNQLHYTNQMMGALEGYAESLAARREYDKAVSIMEEAVAIADSIYPERNSESILLKTKLAVIMLNTDPILSAQIRREVITDLSPPGQPPGVDRAMVSNAVPHLVLTELQSWKRIQQKGLAVRDSLIHTMDDYEKYLSKNLGIMSEEQILTAFSEVNKEIYTLAIILLLEEKQGSTDLRTMVRWSDLYKGNVLRMQAQKADLSSYSPDLSEWQKREIEIKTALRKVYVQIENSEEKDDVLLQEIGDLQEQLIDLKQEIQNNHPDVFVQRYKLSVLPKDEPLQKLPFSATDIIQFVDADSLLLAFIISSGDIRLAHWEVDEKAELSANADSNSNTIIHRIIRTIREIATGKRWIIIPDGKLHNYNFEQCTLASGEYLIIEYTISYAVNISSLMVPYTMTKESHIGSFTPGFLDELKDKYISYAPGNLVDSSWLKYLQQPFMLSLASDLISQFRTKGFSHEKASERQFREVAKQFSILHLGTHAEAQAHYPLHSHIIFAKDIEDSSAYDGYLHTYEIYGMDLSADLAVLSACETGTGHIQRGEGILSLAHAFQYAGCPALITSLWKIDEKSSAEILKKFYEKLSEGSRVSEALRAAKLHYIDEAPPALRHPYYWAGLVVVGHDPIIQLADPLNVVMPVIMAIIGLLFGLLLILIRYRSEKG